ncbi:MAG: NUDIX hydrolase [Negativicutes bacterium]|nr:NUDIX hydrolase [Negativicutes bacterium]
MTEQRFRFCPKCGGALNYQEVNTRHRLVCAVCRYILYENPVVGVAGIVLDRDRILLGRRAAGATYPAYGAYPVGMLNMTKMCKGPFSGSSLRKQG